MEIIFRIGIPEIDWLAELLKFPIKGCSRQERETFERMVFYCHKNHIPNEDDEEEPVIGSDGDVRYKKPKLRWSGESMFVHEARCTLKALYAGFDILTAIAMMGHELEEDDGWTFEQLEEAFGTDVAVIIDAVSKRPKEQFPDPGGRENRMIDHITRMGEITPECWRVPVLKNDDRGDNAHDTDRVGEAHKRRLFVETHQNFIPYFEASQKYIPDVHVIPYGIWLYDLKLACFNYFSIEAQKAKQSGWK